jgi:hypothetical protein
LGSVSLGYLRHLGSGAGLAEQRPLAPAAVDEDDAADDERGADELDGPVTGALKATTIRAAAICPRATIEP